MHSGFPEVADSVCDNNPRIEPEYSSIFVRLQRRAWRRQSSALALALALVHVKLWRCGRGRLRLAAPSTSRHGTRCLAQVILFFFLLPPTAPHHHHLPQIDAKVYKHMLFDGSCQVCHKGGTTDVHLSGPFTADGYYTLWIESQGKNGSQGLAIAGVFVSQTLLASFPAHGRILPLQARPRRAPRRRRPAHSRLPLFCALLTS